MFRDQLLSLARAAARSARAALQASDSCAWWVSRQARMAPLARSMLGQNFSTSAPQAARNLARASCLAGSGVAVCATASIGSTASVTAMPQVLRFILGLQGLA